MAGPRLFLVCGLPGAGKTTRAKQLEAKFHAIRFSPDEWLEDLSLNLYDEQSRARIEALQWKLAQALLQRGMAVILEWGTWGRHERDTLRLGARKLGAGVELHYLTAPIDVLYERVQQRARENPPITRSDIATWVAMFETPTPQEIALFDPPLSAS
jgi:predicted kinase